MADGDAKLAIIDVVPDAAELPAQIGREDPGRTDAQGLERLLSHARRNPVLTRIELGHAGRRDEDRGVLCLLEHLRELDESDQGIVARRRRGALGRVDDQDVLALRFLLEQPHPGRAVESDDAVQVLDQAIRVGVLRAEEVLGDPLPPLDLTGEQGVQVESLQACPMLREQLAQDFPVHGLEEPLVGELGEVLLHVAAP